jgi:hypothetical protein
MMEHTFVFHFGSKQKTIINRQIISLSESSIYEEKKRNYLFNEEEVLISQPFSIFQTGAVDSSFQQTIMSEKNYPFFLKTQLMTTSVFDFSHRNQKQTDSCFITIESRN